MNPYSVYRLILQALKIYFLTFLLFFFYLFTSTTHNNGLKYHPTTTTTTEFFYVTIASLVDNGVQAPLFQQEPISELVFSNESGSLISCSAHGNPTPVVTFVQKDSSTPISPVPGLRYNLHTCTYKHIYIIIKFTSLEIIQNAFESFAHLYKLNLYMRPFSHII